MSDNIAKLAIYVRADIGSLRQGLGHAKRELDSFDRRIRESQTKVAIEPAKIGIVRAFNKGQDIGTKFGEALNRGIEKTLAGGKALKDYFTEPTIVPRKWGQYQTQFVQDISRALPLVSALGTGISSVGRAISKLPGLLNRAFIPSAFRKFVDESLSSVNNKYARGMLSGMTKIGLGVPMRLFQGMSGGIGIVGKAVEFGRNFGTNFTKGVELGWSKLTRKPVPFRLTADTTQSQLQRVKGITPNIAAQIEPRLEASRVQAGKWSKPIFDLNKELSAMRGIGPKTLEKIGPLLTLESVYKRIGDSIRGISKQDVWAGLTKFSGFNKLKEYSKYLVTLRDYQENPKNTLMGPLQQESRRPISRALIGSSSLTGGLLGVGAYSTKKLGQGLGRLYNTKADRLGGQAFTGLLSVASTIPGKLMSIFQTLNPFEVFTRSLLAFKTTAVLALGTIGIASIRLSGQFEQFKVAFEALTGDKQIGEKTFGEMTQFAAKTPFAIREVMAASQMLLGYGTKAEQLYPTLKMIGELTSAIGNDYVNLQHVTYLFGTMQQQGHVFTRDVNQLANIGIPIYEALADVLKVNKQEIQGMVEAGKIGFPDMQRAFMEMTKAGGKFNGFMEKQSRTLLGLWRNTLDNLEIAGARFGDVLVKEFDLKGLLTNAMNVTQNTDMIFFKYKSEIQDIVDLTKSGIGYAIAFGTHMAAGFTVLKDIGISLFPETIKYIETLSKGGKDLSTNWTEAKGNMLDIFKQIAMGFGRMLDRMESGIEQIATMFNKAMRKIDVNGAIFGKELPIEQEIYQRDPGLSGLTQKYNEFLKVQKAIEYNRTAPDSVFQNAKPNPYLPPGANQLDNSRDAEYNRLVNIFNPLSKELKDSNYSKRYNDLYHNIQSERGVYVPKFGTTENMMKEFFEVQERNQKNAIKLEQERMRIFESAPHKAVDELLDNMLGGVMKDFKSIYQLHNTYSDSKYDFGGKATTIPQYNAMSAVGGGLILAGAKNELASRFEKAGKSFYTSWFDDPEKRGVIPYVNPITQEMIQLMDSLKKEKSPYQELNDTLFNLRTLFKYDMLKPDLYAQGVNDIYKKIGDKTGTNEPKFANPIYQGSHEALKVENEAKMGMFSRTNIQENMERIAIDAYTLQKAQLDTEKDILKVLEKKNNNWLIRQVQDLMGP